ncbi:MAG TPA: cytochrome c maturation protein CcmE [Saprospiraceae bacterium]|nr:cytochrome c maturation protein CcmE [Saprospiraceae bacterium]
MKRIYIIAGVMLAVAIGVLVSATGDMSTYTTFAEASHSSRKVKIAGQLAKDKAMEYNPEKDPNYFSFFIKDAEGIEKKVVLLAAKPQDFELSEQIVVTGKMQDDTFVATDLLMKCPSKYKDEEVTIRSERG